MHEISIKLCVMGTGCSAISTHEYLTHEYLTTNRYKLDVNL